MAGLNQGDIIMLHTYTPKQFSTSMNFLYLTASDIQPGQDF